MMSEQPSITAADLSERLGATLEGDGTRVIRAVATLEEAGPEALAWVGAPEFLKKASESRAGVVLLPKDLTLPAGRTVIRVADPDVALCDILRYLAPPVDQVARGGHPTAIVHPEANVEGVAIGANVVVERGAVIGAGSQLHPGVYVGGPLRLFA